MSSLERILTAVRGEEPDIVPVCPGIFMHAAKISGIKLSEFCTNRHAFAKANLVTYKRYGYDGIWAGIDAFRLPELMGCKVKVPENGVPFIVERVIKELKDLDRIKTPDFNNDSRLKEELKGIEILSKELKDQVAIAAFTDCGFEIAAMLMGEYEFLKNLYVNPDFIMEAISIASAAAVQHGKALVDAGVHVVIWGSAFTSPNVISPTIFEKFAYPSIMKEIKEMHRYGAIVSLHICGNATPIIEKEAEISPDMIEFDSPVNLSYAKKKVGDNVCIYGNVDNSRTLFLGSPRDVERECMECIRKAGEGGGFILGSGCDVPIDAPPENIESMINTARGYGRYSLELG